MQKRLIGPTSPWQTRDLNLGCQGPGCCPGPWHYPATKTGECSCSGWKERSWTGWNCFLNVLPWSSSLELLLQIQTPKLYTWISDSGNPGFLEIDLDDVYGTHTLITSPNFFAWNIILITLKWMWYLKAAVAYATTSHTFSSHFNSGAKPVTDGDNSDHSTPSSICQQPPGCLEILWDSHILPFFLP